MATPRRCSRCRNLGHFAPACPHSDEEARAMKLEYSLTHPRSVPLRVHYERWRASQPTPGDAPRYSTPPPRMIAPSSVWAQEEEIRRTLQLSLDRVEWLQRPVSSMGVVNPGPTVRERAVQDILFENSEKIPDGLYKQLMDALVLRG